jgi:hypothetical protein
VRSATSESCQHGPAVRYKTDFQTDERECAGFLLLRNRDLGPLAVTVLPIPLARRAAATACAAVQSTTPLFRRWRRARLSAIGPRSVTLTASYVRRPTLYTSLVGFGCKLRELQVEPTVTDFLLRIKAMLGYPPIWRLSNLK